MEALQRTGQPKAVAGPKGMKRFRYPRFREPGARWRHFRKARDAQEESLTEQESERPRQLQLQPLPRAEGQFAAISGVRRFSSKGREFGKRIAPQDQRQAPARSGAEILDPWRGCEE